MYKRQLINRETLSGSKKWLSLDSYPPLDQTQRANFQQLTSIRETARIDGYPITDSNGGDGTLALARVGDQVVVGSNSTNWDAIQRGEMDAWAQEIGFIPRADQVLDPMRHAEAQSLKKIWDTGTIPDKVVLSVDRIACKDCWLDLPNIAEKMGVSQLVIVLPDGRYSVSTDGEPLLRSWKPDELSQLTK